MKLLSAAGAIVAIGLSTAAAAENLGTSSAAVTEVDRRLESGSLVVGLIAQNRSATTADIGVACAALQDGDAIETEGFVIHAIGPGKKGYEEIVFDRVHRISVEVGCWIDALDTAE